MIVIGGGITGAGIALDASVRGLKVALVEMEDFASGTSSRSTKLIHGGLRYLKQMDFKLVAEVGKERAIVYQNAPHLTKPEHLLLPIVKGGALNMFTGRLGMTLYELLAGVKKTEWHQVLNKEKTMAAESLLKKDNLLGGILFYEYRTDDARLTIEVIKEAVDRGTLALNYLKAVGFEYQNKTISGVKLQDQITKQTFELKAKYIVNATGPWVDVIDEIDKPQGQHKLLITKGIHIVVDGNKFPLKQSSYFDTFDKRMIFVIPREGKVYIGTTDTFYKEEIINPKATKEDVGYLLKCVNDNFPTVQLMENDIESGWVGLRPLIQKPGKGPSEISRKDELFISDSGLITIAGGKLTGYRKMAQHVVDLVAEKIKQSENISLSDCTTASIVLAGGKVGGANKFIDFAKIKTLKCIQLGISNTDAILLVNRFGSNVDKVLDIYSKLSAEKDLLPLILRAQLHYCIEYEMCYTPTDFFVRRTGIMYFDITIFNQWELGVLIYMQKIFDWDNSKLKMLESELKRNKFTY